MRLRVYVIVTRNAFKYRTNCIPRARLPSVRGHGHANRVKSRRVRAHLLPHHRLVGARTRAHTSNPEHPHRERRTAQQSTQVFAHTHGYGPLLQRSHTHTPRARDCHNVS